jgi:hypothetical protein
MNINNNLDLTLSSEYDLSVERGRDLQSTINCTYLSGGTEVPFSFSAYTGATMTIKNEQGTIIMQFSTLDGSIVLGSNSFQLVKDAAEMLIPRAQTYNYDMYISGVIPKRGFLRGKITFLQNISI